MIEVLLTLIPSLCWLVFRCYQLFHTPTDQLARQLNVEIPHTPVVCIDQLGSSHTFLHWDIDSSPDENIFFVLLVNGKDAGTLANNSAKLSNLVPDTLYIIQVLAVNAINNFRSQSTAVFIHTLPENTESNKSLLGMDSFTSSTKEVEIPCTVKDSNISDSPSDLSPAEVNGISNEKTLARYLVFYLNELKRVTKETHEASSHQQKEEELHKSTIENYKKELNEGSDFRAKKDVDLKGLENRKNTLTFEKLKLSKQLKSFEGQRNLHISKLTEMKSKVTKLQEKHHHMINTNKTENVRCTEQIKQLKKDITDTKAMIATIEDAVKTLTTERKKLSTTVSSLELLVKQFVSPPAPPTPDGQSSNGSGASGEIISRDGVLTKLGTEVVRQICDLKPEWETEIKKELDLLATAEITWKADFRNAIQRFLVLHNGIEISRGNKDPGYEPKCLTEYSASVEFGGFANALPKFGSKRRNQLVEEETSFSSPSPDESLDNGYNHFSHVYENQDTKSSGSLYNPGYEANLGVTAPSPLHPVQLNTLVNPLFEQTSPFISSPIMGHSHLNDYVVHDREDTTFATPRPNGLINYMDGAYADQYQDTGISAQTEGLLNRQFYQQDYHKDYQPEVQQEYQQKYQQEYPQEFQQLYKPDYHPQEYSQQYQQEYPPAYQEYPKEYQNYPKEYQEYPKQYQEYSKSYQECPKEYQEYPKGYQEYPTDYQQEYADPQLPRLDLPGSIPHSSMQQYAQNIRQSFPCEDPVYRSSSPEGNLLYPSVQNTLWQNSSQASFREMRPFLGISLLPSSAHMDLAMPALKPSTLPSTLPNDNTLFSSILLSTSNSQISNNIWLDRPMGSTTSQKHNRNVSGGSLLWRLDMRNEVAPLGMMSEFSPFAPTRTNDSEVDNI